MSKKWTRNGGRLVRLSTLLEENVLKSEDVLILKADATGAIDRLIVQHNISKKPRVRNFSQDCVLLSLPLEIFLSVTAHLDVRDVESLSMTCKDLNNMIRRIFVPRVVLPLSEQNMQLLGGPAGRFVLSLCSSLNIRLWASTEFEELLNKMNLQYVKDVKFVGNNYNNLEDGGGGLITAYKNVMKNIVLHKKFVRKLDISIDSSHECYMQLERLKEMPFLEELCLRSSGFRSQWNQIMPQERTLSELLKNTLKGLKISTLELKAFTMPWGDYSRNVEIQIFSRTIQTLKLQYSKNCELTCIDADKLKEIQISSDYYFCFCLYHAQSTVDGRLAYDPDDPPGRLAGILAQGCPNLEKYNGMDLTSLVRNGSWLEELKYHKGEGLDTEDKSVENRCQQCRIMEEPWMGFYNLW